MLSSVTRLTAPFTCDLVYDLLMCELKEHAVYDSECPYNIAQTPYNEGSVSDNRI